MAHPFFVPTRIRHKSSWVLAALIIAMTISLWLNPARAEDPQKGFTFGLSEKMEVKDTQKYMLPFKSGDTLRGTGGCYGPFFTSKYGGRWLADFLSVCTLAAISEDGSGTGTGGIDIINLFGIQGGIQYDPKNGKPFYTFGISITGLANQLLK